MQYAQHLNLLNMHGTLHTTFIIVCEITQCAYHLNICEYTYNILQTLIKQYVKQYAVCMIHDALHTIYIKYVKQHAYQLLLTIHNMLHTIFIKCLVKQYAECTARLLSCDFVALCSVHIIQIESQKYIQMYFYMQIQVL